MLEGKHAWFGKLWPASGRLLNNNPHYIIMQKFSAKVASQAPSSATIAKYLVCTQALLVQNGAQSTAGE